MPKSPKESKKKEKSKKSLFSSSPRASRKGSSGTESPLGSPSQKRESSSSTPHNEVKSKPNRELQAQEKNETPSVKSPQRSPAGSKRKISSGKKRKNKPSSGPQNKILENCVAKLNKAVQSDAKTVQRYLIILGIGDPTIVRSTANLADLLGDHLERLKPCVNALVITITTAPNILCDELAQNPDYCMHLFGALAERITLYDYFQKHPPDPTHSERHSIDHRFWEFLTPQDRFGSMIAFYCKITRLYLEKQPGAIEKGLKANMEFLMYQMQIAEEILSEELVSTVQLMVTKTDCLGFFVNMFMKVTHKVVLTAASDQEVFLEPELVFNASNQYCINLANVMNFILVTKDTNQDVRNALISDKILSMQFFPILLAAVFRAKLCKGYLPLFYQLMDTQRHLFKASHMNAIDAQVDRIARIIRYATLQSKQTFGIARYHALRVLIPLIRFEHASINLQIFSSSILPLLFVLMFDTYPHSTLIHRVIVDIFTEILKNKTRRNKHQSVFCLLTEGDHEQLLSLLNILANHTGNREFGVDKEVSYLEPARIIFGLFDEISRIRDVIKTDSELATKWKTISKGSKIYESSVDKAQAKTQKIVSQAKKQKAAEAEDIDNEFAVVSKLKTMENADSDDITNLSFLQLKRAFRSMSMQ